MKKIDTAVGIVRNTPDKSLALSEIMNILGVSRSNAFVYYTKATKALTSYDVVDSVLAGRPGIKKVTAVQGRATDARAKRAKKVADIDAVIASLKGNPVSPFSGLGA
jgi:DNA-binding transcriptional regulator GbsR (MarR family)